MLINVDPKPYLKDVAEATKRISISVELTSTFDLQGRDNRFLRRPHTSVRKHQSDLNYLEVGRRGGKSGGRLWVDYLSYKNTSF